MNNFTKTDYLVIAFSTVIIIILLYAIMYMADMHKIKEEKSLDILKQKIINDYYDYLLSLKSVFSISSNKAFIDVFHNQELLYDGNDFETLLKHYFSVMDIREFSLNREGMYYYPEGKNPGGFNFTINNSIDKQIMTITPRLSNVFAKETIVINVNQYEIFLSNATLKESIVAYFEYH